MRAPIETSPLAWLEAAERQRREAGLRRSLRPRPAVATPAALDRGVWLRPFRNLVYAMPPYICPPDQIAQIASAMVDIARLVG